jgi:sugar transferase (PEP-CTERM/EpsH1 system associated)
LNILVLAGNIPATSRMPGSPRLFSLCRVLARDHRLFLLSHCSSPERRRSFAEDPAVTGVFHDVTILDEAPPPTWWGRQHHRLRLAPHFVTRYRSPSYHRAVVEIIRERLRMSGPAELIYVDGLWMTQYVAKSYGVPVVVDLHDSHTLLYQRLLAREQHLVRRLPLYLEGRSIARWERALSGFCDLIITNSTVDEAVIRRLEPSSRTVTITNGVDTEYFTPARPRLERPTLVFTGVMDYGPNEDAVLYFCQEVLPLLRRSLPEIEFWAVGPNPSPRVADLARVPGVHVTGRVDDVRPYVESAGVFVCPLRAGAGMKNKILAAMAMRRPVVATSLSLEGIDVRPDEHVLMADGAEPFAAQVLRLLREPPLADRLADQAYTLVTERYSWNARGESLDVLLRALGPSDSRPQG